VDYDRRRDAPISDGRTRDGASMIVGSGQFSDGYGNARVHKYSPTARRGSACRPATPTSSPGRDQFRCLSDRNRRAGAERGEGHSLWRAVARAARFYSL